MIKIQVEIEMTAIEEILAKLKDIPAVVKPAFEDFAAAAVLAAQDEWPIDSGDSFRAWDSSLEVGTEQIKVFLRNDEHYSGWVYRAKTANNDDNRVWKQQRDEIVNTELPILQADCVALIEQIPQNL